MNAINRHVRRREDIAGQVPAWAVPVVCEPAPPTDWPVSYTPLAKIRGFQSVCASLPTTCEWHRHDEPMPAQTPAATTDIKSYIT